MSLRRTQYQGPIDLVPRGVKVDLAYSLRRMSWRYRGPFVELRRGSDSATLDIYGDRNNVIDRSVIAAFCAGTTGFVRTWYDQSGSGCHAQQTTAGSQATLFTGGDLVRDSYRNPRISHTATGQIYNFDPTLVATGSNPSTCFSVTMNATAVGVRSRWSLGTNAASSYRTFETDNGNLPRVNNGTTSVATTVSDLNTPLIGAARFSRGSNPSMSLRARWDDAANDVQSVTANPATWTTGTTFGKIWGRPADTTSVVGYSYEYMFLAANLSDADLARISANLEEYYGFNR
jgi:hypothetical protein